MNDEDELLSEIKETVVACISSDDRSTRQWAMQCHLLLKVLEKLDFVNTNLIDIEHEVSNLNPMYK